MQYASEGDLHKYLQKNFTIIDWQQKIDILKEITFGYLYLNT
jgi:hypothetical protein